MLVQKLYGNHGHIIGFFHCKDIFLWLNNHFMLSSLSSCDSLHLIPVFISLKGIGKSFLPPSCIVLTEKPHCIFHAQLVF